MVVNLMLGIFRKIYDSPNDNIFALKFLKTTVIPYIMKLMDTFIQDLETAMRFLDTEKYGKQYDDFMLD
jgi:hypothetical protein